MRNLKNCKNSKLTVISKGKASNNMALFDLAAGEHTENKKTRNGCKGPIECSDHFLI
jgi:hypothetical protein